MLTISSKFQLPSDGLQRSYSENVGLRDWKSSQSINRPQSEYHNLNNSCKSISSKQWFEFVQQTIVNTVTFSACGRFIASGSSGGQILIWDIPQGFLVAEFSNHSAPIHSLAFSRDGTMLASGMLHFLHKWNRYIECMIIIILTF